MRVFGCVLTMYSPNSGFQWVTDKRGGKLPPALYLKTVVQLRHQQLFITKHFSEIGGIKFGNFRYRTNH